MTRDLDTAKDYFHTRYAEAPDAGASFPRSAFKVLERLRRNKSGWGEAQLRKPYEGFGFVARDLGNHVHYRHPDHPELRGQVPRHRSLRDYMAADAVATIDELLRLEAEEDHEQGP